MVSLIHHSDVSDKINDDVPAYLHFTECMCALILYVLFILQLCLKRNLCFSNSEGDRSVSILVRVLGTPLREEEACPRDKSGVQEEDRMEHWGSVLAPCPGREPLLLLLVLLLSVGPCLDRDGMQIHRG